jgi:hypothetical protein
MAEPAFASMLTIAVTAYPVTAQLPERPAPGYFSAVHLGVTGDPDVIVSFDGVNDHERLRVGTVASAIDSQTPQYAAAWFKLSSAGSVAIKATIEREGRR